MKLSRFLSTTILITGISLLYVHQQTEIFRLAYTGQKKQASFEELLDKNCVLRYNIEKNASLACLADKISGYADFQMPDNYELITLLPYGEGRSLTAEETSAKPALLSRIFGIKRQAEAGTLNP